MEELVESNKKAILVGVGSHKDELNESLLELENLALANNIDIVEVFRQHVNHINNHSYVQKGKLEEIAEFLSDNPQISTFIANDELTASQVRNIQKVMSREIEVLDRTTLILDIFANRAKTKEAKIQVEIAKLQYDLAHLVFSDEDYDQQRGGSLATRGAGERRIDLDRRVLKERIRSLQNELKNVDVSLKTQKKQREKNEMLLVSLVGYTNAGKSTIMNNLVNEDFNKKVIAKNMLFATLDTSVRKIYLPNHREVLLSDTVGFIDKLPHQLVKSFKSTLEVACDADLIIHVVDYSNPNYQKHINITNQTLKEVGVDMNKPMIYVLNKADKIEDQPFPIKEGNKIIISAKDEDSIMMLKEGIVDNLFADIEEVNLIIPYDKGEIIDYLYSQADIIEHDQIVDGHLIKANLTSNERNIYKDYLM